MSLRARAYPPCSTLMCKAVAKCSSNQLVNSTHERNVWPPPAQCYDWNVLRGMQWCMIACVHMAVLAHILSCFLISCEQQPLYCIAALLQTKFGPITNARYDLEMPCSNLNAVYHHHYYCSFDFAYIFLFAMIGIAWVLRNWMMNRRCENCRNRHTSYRTIVSEQSMAIVPL